MDYIFITFYMNLSKFKVQILFIAIIIITCVKNSEAIARCICKCVDNQVKIICRNASDIKPVCMPFKCKGFSTNNMEKIAPPEGKKSFLKKCRSLQKTNQENGDILLIEKCQ